MLARVVLLTIVACAVGLPPAAGTAAAARERVFTVTGEGGYGTSGDGGLASRADVTMAGDLAALPDGGFLFIDGNRVRRLAPDGRISTVAGGGDGPTPATRATLDQPTGVAAMPDRGFVVAERVGRVRRIDASGAITTVAGGGSPVDPGEGRPATEVTFSEPVSVAAQADGSFLVATAGLVRRVGPDGIVTRVAGRLTVSAGRRALDEFGFVYEEEEPENGYSARTRIGACQIVGDRVDCRIEVELNDEPLRCDAIVATRLRPTGQLRTRCYQCGRFRAAPRWFPDSEWQEQALRRP